ncbi:MAG: hypothetical protein R3F54_18380 [Alphaproteobacteria bacterium]
MLFNLIGMVVAGVAAAGCVLLACRLVRKRPPKWLLPMVAGAAMLSFHLWNEYSWFDRVTRGLPERMQVAERYTYESLLQPWTLLVPRINRFTAVDRGSIRRNERAPGYVMADILLVKRLDPAVKLTQLYDCRQARRTDILSSTEVDERGLPVNASWIDTERDHAVFRAICDEGRG